MTIDECIDVYTTLSDGFLRRRIMREDRPRMPPPSRASRRRSAAGMGGGAVGVQDGDQEGDGGRDSPVKCQ